jgi:NAD(P)H-hydrate epimerase
MRRLDQRAIAELGIPGETLMENAGRGAAREILGLLARQGRRGPRLSVVVVAGKGNNGGDGFVVARILRARGARVRVFLTAPRAAVTGDAARALARLERAGIRPVELATESDLDRLARALGRAHLVVDALLGTGASGPPSGLVARAIDRINAAARPTVALDLPSGLGADRGETAGAVIRACMTTTFAGLKHGLLLATGPDVSGDVRVVAIGIPETEVRRDVRAFLVEPEDVRREFPRRGRDTHKGTYGHLLIVAGSEGKTGAAALAGRAAMRAGAGLVTVATPRSQQPVIAAMLAEPMTEALPETGSRTLAAGARERILELAEARDAVALGPGLGRDPETQALVRDLTRTIRKPMVIDADALTALAGHLDALAAAPAPRCLTPHPGEMARLLGVSTTEVQATRIETVRRFASAHATALLLKGHLSVIGGPDGRVFLNPTGNPGLASGGTGDVLTGMVGALLARGVEPVAALTTAAYLHGLAGDLAAAAIGEDGLIASDVIQAIPTAIRQVQQRGDDRDHGADGR